MESHVRFLCSSCLDNFVATECSAKFLVSIGVFGCGCLIFMSSVFVVRLHGHLHTFRRFLILLTMSLPLLLFGWFLTPPHCFSGFRHSPIRKNVLLPGLLPCVQWGTMYHYYMPISCHLHGMLLSHIGVMLHNLGTFYFLRFFWFIWFNCSDAMNLSAANIVILVALLL